jgi:hypothetical protein
VWSLANKRPKIANEIGENGIRMKTNAGILSEWMNECTVIRRR